FCTSSVGERELDRGEAPRRPPRPGANKPPTTGFFLIPACAAVLDRCSIKTASLAMFGSVKLARTTPPGSRSTPRLRGSNSPPLRLSVINDRCVSLIESEVGGSLGAVRESKKPDKRGICRMIVGRKQLGDKSAANPFPLFIFQLSFASCPTTR